MIKNPQYRRMAIDTLCQVIQQDSSAKNRRDAAKALAVYGEESIPCLCQALKQENSPKVRSQIISSLKKLGYTEEKTMSETSKYNFPNAQNIQIVEHTDGGDVIAHNYATPQNLTEAATEIQELLAQLEKNYPTVTAEVIEQEIKQNPTFKARLIHTLKAGGIETVKLLFAPLGIPIEMIKAWVETA